MSQQGLKLVRAVHEALSRGEVDAALERWTAPDCELDVSRALGPVHGTYRGPDQIRQAFAEFYEPWESVRNELDEVLDAGENVVASLTAYFRGRDGVEVRTRTAFVWTIRDGLIARICFFQERQDALAAAGLSD